ncbi:MAG: 50S ribosomal protein L3 [Candidatus Daviesbacteria bacterium]|nr:50S ribosomal protein L3 [Candidatus Daviesbacteria bacterium]
MINSLLGIKRNMTATYDARGRRVGATIVEVLPNFVTAVKTKDSKDGYNSVQLGTGTKKSVNKPQIGQLKKVGIEQKVRWLREIRTDEIDLNPGTSIELGQVFSVGDSVKVTGISKGKGFQGGVRRHGFAGGPKTHGQSDRHRAPGSIGQTTTPGRVYKGKKMAGHMGVDTVSVRGLEVVSLDKKTNLLVLKGAVPGFIGGLVTITKLGRIKGYTPPPEEKEDEEEAQDVKLEAENTEPVKTDSQVSQDVTEKQEEKVNG